MLFQHVQHTMRKSSLQFQAQSAFVQHQNLPFQRPELQQNNPHFYHSEHVLFQWLNSLEHQ